MHNIYMQAYARGYYYGRMGIKELNSINEMDYMYMSNQGWAAGITAGKNDFIEIELTQEAIGETNV